LWVPQLLGAQLTLIGQDLLPFPALDAGPHSLSSRGDLEATDTYTLYAGVRLPRRLEVYVDLEMARGAAVGGALGLAAFTNGDVIRQGNVTQSDGPYVARAYLEHVVPWARAPTPSRGTWTSCRGPRRSIVSSSSSAS